MTKGYLFACTDKSEKECFENNLFGTSYIYGDGVLELEPGDSLFLVNLESDRLFGPFHATTKGSYNLDSKVWGDKYPYQVRFEPVNGVKSIEKAKRFLQKLGIKSNEPLEDFEAEALKSLFPQAQQSANLLGIDSDIKALTSLLDEQAKEVQKLRQEVGINSVKAKLKKKPPLQTTTLWDYPTQSYGDTPKGNNKYAGVTPAFIIYNLIKRYTNPGDLVVDPMCGSGTTIDVCKEEGREVIGYDIVSTRPDIIENDARNIPLPDNSVDLVFIDSPYGDNIRYNENPDCIGNISAEDETFYNQLEKVMAESARILKPGKVLGWLIGDQWVKKKFTPVGFKVYERLCKYFEPVDIVCVVRRSQISNTGIWHNRALRFNFFLRGFKYLLLVRKAGFVESQHNNSRVVKWTQYKRKSSSNRRSRMN